MKPLRLRYRVFDQHAFESEDEQEREPSFKDECALEAHRRAAYLQRRREEEEGAAVEIKPPKPPAIRQRTLPKPEPKSELKPASQPTQFKPRARITSPQMSRLWVKVTTDILSETDRELITGFGVFRLSMGRWFGDRDGYWYELHPEPIESSQSPEKQIDMTTL